MVRCPIFSPTQSQSLVADQTTDSRSSDGARRLGLLSTLSFNAAISACARTFRWDLARSLGAMGEVLLHLVAQPAPGVAAVGGPRQLWARKLKRKNPRRKGTHLPSSERVGMHVDDTLPQTNMEDPLKDLVHLTEYSAWWQNEAGKRECAKTFTWSANADAFLLRLQPDLITYSSLIRPLAPIRKLMYARVRILQRKLLVTGGFVCVCLCVCGLVCVLLCVCVCVYFVCAY